METRESFKDLHPWRRRSLMGRLSMTRETGDENLDDDDDYDDESRYNCLQNNNNNNNNNLSACWVLVA